MRFRNIYMFAMAMMLAGTSFAQTPGTLDNTFGQGGVVYTPQLNGLYNVPVAILQPTSTVGKLITVGNVDGGGTSIGRYLLSGVLDSSFGTNGTIVDPTVLSFGASATGAMLQPDQKILVKGFFFDANSQYQAYLTRYQTSGLRDSSFGTNGTVNAGYGQFGDFAIQPDGKILVVNDTGLLTRYNGNGTIDNSFGANGVTTANQQFRATSSIALQPDGKILIGGDKYSNTNFLDPLVARFLPGGGIDSTFGTNGYVIPSISAGSAFVSKLLVDANGKIVIAGAGGNSLFSFIMERLHSNGTHDVSFNTQHIKIGQANDFFTGLTIQPDGKIVAGGIAQLDLLDNSDAILMRFQTNGNLDSMFAQNGIAQEHIAQKSIMVSSMLQQADGKIALCASISDTVNYDFNGLLLRYNMGVTTPVPTTASSLHGLSSGIAIYPNPVNDQLFIDRSKMQSQIDGHFELRDITGKIVASGLLNQGVNTVNTSALSSGLYLLQITDGNERTVSKVVKQ